MAPLNRGPALHVDRHLRIILLYDHLDDYQSFLIFAKKPDCPDVL